MPKIGICSECGKSPRHIHHLHPETRNPICSTCSKKLKLGKKSEPEEARKWFLDLANNKAAEWIVNTANSRDPAQVRLLDSLIEQGPEEVKEFLKEIFRPPYPTAQGIIRRFLKTAEGKNLKGLIAQNPDLRRKAGVLHYL